LWWMRSLLLGLLAVAAAVDHSSDSESTQSIVVLIVSNGETRYDERRAEETKRHVEEDMKEEDAVVLISHRDFGGGSWGHHAVWPLIPRITARFPSLRWLVVMETESRMNGLRLRRRLRQGEKEGEEKEIFIGRTLVDEQPVIIHHFYGFDNQHGDVFQYPDFAAGVLLSGRLVRRLGEGLERKKGVQFTIDGKHEFARLVEELTAVTLTSEMDHFCHSPGGSNCLIWFEQQTGTRQGCRERRPLDHSSLLVGVKTYSGFHRTRVVVTKRTWGKNVRNILYYSDVEDPYIPSTRVHIPNTQRGHCKKTMEILKDALHREEMSSRWIFIADDDTLVGLSRLERWLRCYDEDEKVIIGERYGYGYDVSGEGGYDYPTGGAGMVFSLPAARLLVQQCECPSIDSPDDMILGMCARHLSIPIVHSPAMHQARPMDYARSLISRLLPISFHKHEGIDPYEVYTRYLKEAEDESRWDTAREEL
ncbi:hypothetical protein PMAYCL1PPCAC_29823, partial [Pristionchus mayeri]